MQKFIFMISVLFICGLTLLSSSCATRTHHTKPLPESTPAAAGAGAIAGLTAGAASGAALPAATVFGTAAGLSYGINNNNPKTIASQLRASGINVVNYGDTTTIIIPVDYVFTTRSMRIEPQAYNSLSIIAHLMQQLPERNVLIGTGTDSISARSTNLVLSRHRAESLLDYFWALGIERDRMSTQGYADLYPVSSGSTIKANQQNRRIEITLFKPEYAHRVMTKPSWHY